VVAEEADVEAEAVEFEDADEAVVETPEAGTGTDVEDDPEPVQGQHQEAEQDVEAVEEAPEATEPTDPEFEGAGT
jgi:hypothetical protein